MGMFSFQVAVLNGNDRSTGKLVPLHAVSSTVTAKTSTIALVSDRLFQCSTANIGWLSVRGWCRFTTILWTRTPRTRLSTTRVGYINHLLPICSKPNICIDYLIANCVSELWNASPYCGIHCASYICFLFWVFQTRTEVKKNTTYVACILEMKTIHLIMCVLLQYIILCQLIFFNNIISIKHSAQFTIILLKITLWSMWLL